MFVRSPGRVAVATLALSLAAVAVPTPSPAAPEPLGSTSSAVAAATRPAAAADWQARQMRGGSIPSSFDPAFRDWGLTVDSALALAADGHKPGKLARTTQAIEAHYYTDYAVYEGSVSANAMAKALVVAKVLRQPVRDFGGRNVRYQVLRLMLGQGAGREAGRFSDTGDFGDNSNTFGQSYAVIGLARTGGVPQQAVSYLLRQRCAAGYFRIFQSVGTSCNTDQSPVDVDATALALQALLAARQSGATVPPRLLRGTIAWLVSAQRANGSFGGGASTTAPNSNSTGLAAQALQAAGRPQPRADAARWVASLQITAVKAGNGPARRDLGAIAYNRESFRNALSDGVTDSSRDQFIRATPQAYFALDSTPLTTLLAP